MKSRSGTFVLLAAVILVWGIAMFQLFSFFGEDDNQAMKKMNFDNDFSGSESNEEYNLKLNYRDPFLKNVSVLNKSVSDAQQPGKRMKTSTAPMPKPLPVPVLPPAPVDLGFISYTGTIRNKRSNKEVALISIHGSDYSFSEGDSLAGIVLLKNMRDSLHIRYNKNKYIIKKH